MIMMASIFGLTRICRRGGPFCTVEGGGATVSRATLNALDPVSMRMAGYWHDTR
jgi:hypothetical protein